MIAKITSFIMFGLHTFLLEEFVNKGFEIMDNHRGESPQHAVTHHERPEGVWSNLKCVIQFVVINLQSNVFLRVYRSGYIGRAIKQVLALRHESHNKGMKHS